MKEKMVSLLNTVISEGPFSDLITVVKKPNGVYSIQSLTESNKCVVMNNRLEQHTALYRSYFSQLSKINQL